jgi:hypothetical protein
MELDMKILLISGIHPDEITPQIAAKQLCRTIDTIFVPSNGQKKREIYGEDLNRLFNPDILSVTNPTKAQTIAQNIINEVNIFRLQNPNELIVLIDLHSAPKECYCSPHIKMSLKRPIDRLIASYIAAYIPTVVTDELTEYRFRQYYADRGNVVSMTVECGGGGAANHNDVKLIVDAVLSIQKQKPAPYKVYREHFVELDRIGYFESPHNLYNLLGKQINGTIGSIHYLNEPPIPVQVNGLIIGAALLEANERAYDGVPWIINEAREIMETVR